MTYSICGLFSFCLRTASYCFYNRGEANMEVWKKEPFLFICMTDPMTKQADPHPAVSLLAKDGEKKKEKQKKKTQQKQLRVKKKKKKVHNTCSGAKMRVPLTDGRAEIPFTNPPSDLNTASWLSVAGEKPITQLLVTQKAIWSFGCSRRRGRRWGMMQLHWQADTKAARCIFRERSAHSTNNASANTNLQRESLTVSKDGRRQMQGD